MMGLSIPIPNRIPCVKLRAPTGIGPSFVDAPDTVHFFVGHFGLNQLFENEYPDPWVYNGLPTDSGWYKTTDYNLHFYSQRDLTTPNISVNGGSPFQTTSTLIEYSYPL